MEPVKNIEVNGRNYTVKMFSPMEAFDFIHRLVLGRATGEKLEQIGILALRQCHTPDGKSLDDKATFEAHFSAYPADMLDLESAAIDALVEPYEGVKTEEKKGA